MEVILTQRCKSLTGTVGSRFGYYIRSTKTGRFFSQRSRYCELPEAHWFFIVTCAELAKLNLHIADIKVDWVELSNALLEARHFIAKRQVSRNGLLGIKTTYNAADVLNLKITFAL